MSPTDMHNPKVSIIMPVLNGADYFSEAIESVLNQTYSNYDIVIVDGGSTDNSLEIAKKYGLKIVGQPGVGISDAYNTGIRSSSSPFVSFLSSDDLWHPDKLKLQVRVMSKDETLMYTNTRISYFLHDAQNVPKGFRKEHLDKNPAGIIMETLVARREVFDLVGLFDTNLYTAEDVDWFGRAQFLKVKSEVLHKVLLNKRVHQKSISLNTETNNKNLIRAIRKLAELKKNR